MSLPRWAGPENDYRGIVSLPEAEDPSIAVIIPAHQRRDVLQRVLAGLVGSDTSPTEVVVIDDDSPEDIERTVTEFDGQLPIMFRRERYDGFGAGRARNLGVSMTTSDVVLFLDSDCIPSRSLIERHLFWHRRAANAVVAGSRVDVDGTVVDVSSLTSGAEPAAFGESTSAWGEVAAKDWRNRFFRLNRRLAIDDTAYRAALSNNLSVRREEFDHIGGFSPLFSEWGSEDTELGWRLFQAGTFIVPDERAVVFHQIQHDDEAERRRYRSHARAMNLPLLADLIPNRHYRKARASTYTVPSVSWVVRASDADEAERLLAWIDSTRLLDNEVILLASGDAGDRWHGRARSSDRFVVRSVDGTPTVEDAIGSARGEFVVLIDAGVRADRSIIDRMLRRFDDDPRLGIVRTQYMDEAGNVARRIDDCAVLDAVSGFPHLVGIRRRHLAKHAGNLALVEGVARAEAAERSSVLAHPKARVRGQVDRARRADLATLRLVGMGDLSRSLKARASGGRVQAPEAPDAEPSMPGITYVGFTGRANLGDEVILRAIQELLPAFDIRREHPDPDALMIGGGTIINAKGYYLTRVLRETRPGMPTVMFAPGVRHPEFWGTTESMDDWWSVLRTIDRVTVRGPDSVAHLATLGWKGGADVIGDPALALRAPDDAVSRDEAIIAPLHTGGNLYGGSDEPVLAAMASQADRLAAEGLRVVLMSSFPEDDRWILDLERRIGADVDYLTGYSDVESTLARIAGARLVVGERLHASILAAAMGTPFAAIGYRPKTLDFARSLDLDDWVVTTDRIEQLQDLISATLSSVEERRSLLQVRVEPFRDRLRGHAEEVRATLGP